MHLTKFRNRIKKLAGWVGGWMDGWMDEWMDGKAG